MKAQKQDSFTPQLEEDIEKCEWVRPDQLGPYLDHTHASILDVVKAGLEELTGKK